MWDAFNQNHNSVKFLMKKQTKNVFSKLRD